MSNKNSKIETEEEYKAALEEVESLMAAEKGTDGVRLGTLLDLIEEYEDKHFPDLYKIEV